MVRTKNVWVLVLIISVFSFDAAAEVKSADATGFSVSHTISVPVSAKNAYKTMVHHVSEWWNGDHSWSADANNLYIDAKLGGCMCERLPDGGGVEHLRIIHLAPNRLIKFDGSLGPLQDMAVQGRMEWRIEPTDEQNSSITFSYQIHGHMEGGFEGIAPAVDGVIAEQLNRLGERLN